jgi:hypothetical protein
METDLDRLFDDLNNSLFDGQLPKYRVRQRQAEETEYGFIDDAARTIWICRSDELRKTLLHEMCHIGTDGHGRLFRAKLRHLVRRGETWAQDERMYYLRKALGFEPGQWMALLALASDPRGGGRVGLL